VNVSKYTHYHPDIWRRRGWNKETHSAFSSMFQYKAQLFAMEVTSVIVAPYVLCVSLAKCAEPICEFVLATRAEVPGAGDVCGFSTFDFENYGDELWEGGTIGTEGTDPFAESLSESIMRLGSVEEATRRFPKPKAREGKMEKSFFSFKVRH
jgi:autophagy-related protein 9